MPQHTIFNPIQDITTTTPNNGSAQPTKPVVMTDFTGDVNGYKITYSDGWVEVGGYKGTSIAAYGTVSVSFGDSSPFPNGIVVDVHCTPVHTGTTGGAFTDYAVEDVTSTSFNYRKCAANTAFTGFYWVAKGF